MLKNIKYYLLLLPAIIIIYCLCCLFIRRNRTYGVNIRVYTYTAFFDTKVFLLDTNNEIKQRIAGITGAECDETWLYGISRESVVNDYIAGRNYPDSVKGCQEFPEAGALVPMH